MAFPCLRPFSIAAASPRSNPHSAIAAQIHRRRLPLIGALCAVSLGAIAALACGTGPAHSRRCLPLLLRQSYQKRSLAKAAHSGAGMEGGNTVPSIVVYVTVPSRDAGKKLAGSIINEKLAACVNIVPGIESVYWWDGKVQSDSEELLIIKTRASLLDALTEHVKSNHEYDVPEVISLRITGGNDKYLEWIKNSTREN